MDCAIPKMRDAINAIPKKIIGHPTAESGV
jgi:hypothetical protein